MDARAEVNLAGARPRANARTPNPTALLDWYDRARRTLPWRAAPDERPDPYRVWLSEIMLQQTRVETVARYFARFVARWPDVQSLAAAALPAVLSAWAGLGYYARARNLHACAREIVARHDGRFPDTQADLRELPGIGDYTAAAIAAIAFDRAVVPLDGNVERVVARVFAFAKPLPRAKPELRRLAQTLVHERRPGDLAQALMDLGAVVCTPKRPDCRRCPWNGSCKARRAGNPERFPRVTPKRAGALRRGAAFFVRRSDGAILLRTRPARGLLGGMTEVPTSEWTASFDVRRALAWAPDALVWRRLPGAVRHVFTHFPLELTVFAAEAPPSARAPRSMRFVPRRALEREALPTLMRKVIRHAMQARQSNNQRRKR
jgi:A/G-specific adenine glycosylase